MEIDVLSAICGAGKTYEATTKMMSVPGRYLVVRDKVEAIDEFITTLNRRMDDHSISIRRITSETGTSVRYEVEALPERCAPLAHVIAVISHKALMMCDFSMFHGWHIIIDETPVVLDRQDICTSRSTEFFERHYELDPTVAKGWSSVTLTRQGWDTTPANLEEDDLSRPMRVFHERVTTASPAPTDSLPVHIKRRLAFGANQRAVIANLTDWQEMEDGRKWTWWSLWGPHQLEAFESVTMMANGFTQSFTYALLREQHPEIVWNERTLQSSRRFAPRKVVIRYFANSHVASAKLFHSDQGADNLKSIARYLKDQDAIWMANEGHEEHLVGIGGKKLTPHQAGSNKYASYNEATMIYSAKPSSETRSVIKLLGVDEDAWVRSYEYESILQFACRTSIRDPESTATVFLTVYDNEQAEYLREYFAAQSHVTVSMELIDLGFAHVARSKTGGRPVKEITPEAMEAKKAIRREQNAIAARKAREKAKAAKAVK